MEIYEDSFAKIALSLTATQLAKDMLVRSEGIGEDLSFSFFTWHNDRPQMCIQMDRRYMQEEPDGRFKRCSSLAKLLRSNFESQAITFIAEGYVAKAPQQKELSLAFLDDSTGVKECLTVVHCENKDNANIPEMYMFTIPYQYAIPRKVEWGQMMAFSHNAVALFKKYSYPAMMFDAMRSESEMTDLENRSNLVELICNNGFHVQFFEE